MKNLIFILLCLFFSFSIASANSEETFVKANAAYNNANFKEAAKLYNTLVNEGYSNPELFYNLGNSYYRLKEYGKAILYYEKAKALNPHDEDIDFNIKVANTQIIDKIASVPKFFLTEYFDNLKSDIGSDRFATYSLILVWLAVLGFVLFMTVGSSQLKKLLFLISSIILILSLSSFYMSYQSFQFEKNQNYAIVMDISSYVKSSPDEKATDLVILHEGTKLEILDKVSDWYKVRIADGNIGWINAKTIEMI